MRWLTTVSPCLETLKYVGVSITRLWPHHVRQRGPLDLFSETPVVTCSLFFFWRISYLGRDTRFWTRFCTFFFSSKCLLYSRKFSSVKNSVKSHRQAVRLEFFSFVKRRMSLVYSSVVRLSLFCLSFIFAFMTLSDRTTCSFVKISSGFNLVKTLLWRKRRN